MTTGELLQRELAGGVIGPHANERRKAWYAPSGKFLIAKGNRAADRRWLFALGIGKTGADRELSASGQNDAERGAAIGLTLDGDEAVVFVNDLARDGKAEAGAVALGGVKRFKHAI